MSDPAVVIFTEKADWHSHGLARAIEREGLRPLIRSMTEAGFDLATGRPRLHVPGLEGLPEAIFVRLIPAGTTEQITSRLGLLHAARHMGVAVVNDARAIEVCVDKGMTTFMLAEAGLPTPLTLVRERRADAQAAFDAHGGPMVLKPLFGAQGKGVRLVSPGETLPEPGEVGGVYYLQAFVAARGYRASGRAHDWRVFTIGGRAVGAMIRRADEGWITNIFQGAVGEPAAVDGEAAALAVRAARAVGADYAGVDLIEDEDGRFLVLEVNSMPAWKGLNTATGVDVAAELARDLARRLARPDAA
ncbi:lysine biosynthesis protein LysX [Methylopila jiangsuensis]|uniref:Lysine biosynthesis protein LysX n=1 Tax=Methylopila jiangsuensis TaxID=586230 RepID=A0A9W6N2H1_9HYPH|nr:RimK family alpha-L-glutamate ligase [Methylopila jiangsuensis]MDR6286194.1 RimK family alpha-L-glutamate ligase [Methylopila jiangsuensis]GLK75954.1 lysine biosynthesis protein LysX [Methylopila jiangsuensis]